MKTLFSGLETIQFQGVSKAGAELIAMFDHVAEARNKEETDSKRIKKVNDMCKGYMNKELKRIAKKYFNLTISKLILSETATGMFAILPTLGDDHTLAHTVMDIYTGSGFKNAADSAPAPETAKELEEVAESFSKKTASFTKNKLVGETIQGNIDCEIYFDPYMAFLIPETVNKKAAALTSAEVAAIMLHEIGHMMVVIEHCGDKYHQAMEYNTAVEHFKKYASAKEQAKYATSVKLKDVGLDKDKEKLLGKAQEGLSNLFVRDGSVTKQVGALLLGLTTIAITAFLVIAASIYVVTAVKIIRSMESLSVAIKTRKGKRSDQIYTIRNEFLNERNADEFAARHGFASHLISGLKKAHDLSILTITYTSKYNADSTLMWYLSAIPDTLMTLYLGDMSNSLNIYEKQLDRASRLVQSSLKALKEDGCSGELMDFYIKQYENTVAAHAELKSNRKLLRASEAVWNLMEYLASPQSLMKMLISGRLTDEYKKTLDAVDDITTNKQYYHAAKFDQLGR